MKRALTFVTAAAGLLGLVGCENLDDRPNVGPCPVAGSLYEAQRLVELDGGERHENVGFTGAIESAKGYCRYVGKNPITMEIDVTFAFGRGPKAVGNSKTYSYFTAVTRRDSSVLAKQSATVKADFPKGATVVRKTVTVTGIVIPRATETISGTNFEVLLGFDLTPDQLAFNRSGKRFLMNVGQAATVSDQRPNAAPAPKAGGKSN